MVCCNTKWMVLNKVAATRLAGNFSQLCVVAMRCLKTGVSAVASTQCRLCFARGIPVLRQTCIGRSAHVFPNRACYGTPMVVALFVRSPDDASAAAAAVANSQQHRLAKKLGVTDLIAYGIGCIVGAGIYSLIAFGAAAAGPAIVLSFVVGGFACLLTSLCYSEFASRVRLTGSAYTYAYISMGEFPAWM